MIGSRKGFNRFNRHTWNTNFTLFFILLVKFGLKLTLQAILRRNNRENNMTRQISKLEERVYRLCHHDFGGKTIDEAAALMKISTSKVRRLLKNLEQKSPQLFPILTHRQFAIYKMITEQGMTQEQIAKIVHLSQPTIYAMIQRMKDQGMPGLDVQGIGKTVSYDNSLDQHVRQKF